MRQGNLCIHTMIVYREVNCIRSMSTVYYYLSDCSRTCQNEGTLDPGNCTCICASGFSGDNCESEYTMRCLCELIKLAENVHVSECKLINARTGLKAILHCI